ncbi:MAG: BNR-4 repeat-containing protein [Gemmatimonadetes bacterium]|nr:BNR-4 repeat-containing protein [Gemmatimonadota bacterium]
MDRIALACLALVLLAGSMTGCDRDWVRPRPAEEFPELTSDGAWCWFGDPRGVRYQGAHGRIYAGWVDSEGSIVVSSLDLETGERAQHTVQPEFNRDDHANPSLMVLPDGTVVVFYTSHGSDVSDAMYYRVSRQPEDITAWSEAREIGSNTDGPRGYTYPNPVRLSNEGGRIYLFWRGGNFKPSFSFTDDLLTWSPARTLIQSDETTTVRPYMKIASNGGDAIHFAFTDGHPRNEPHNSIYYVRYRQGEFTRADGSSAGTMEDLPLIHERADLVYDGRMTGVRAWIWDVAADEEGNPVIVYTRLPEESDHRYHYARWNGAEWVDHEITAAGGWFPETPAGSTEPEPHYSGGIVLDHENPSVAYLSRPVADVFEIERWWTTDGGATWGARPVTAGSANDNVRPFVIRNHDAASPTLLWMENRRYRHYLDYETAIRMDRAPG